MSDKHKIIFLVIVVFIFTAGFIGVGLTWDNYQYFLSRRVPKVLAILVAGCAISYSSFCFQTITNNRILTPSIMGFDSLYLLVQVLTVILFGGVSIFMQNAFVNFTVSVGMMLTFSSLFFMVYLRYAGSNIISLLLLGVICGQLFQSISSFFSMLLDPDEFALVQANMFASFNNIDTELVYWTLPILIIICILLYAKHRILDVYLLDQDNAISLGVDIQKNTRDILILSTILVAISTALVGPILFFGLLITNLTREWFKTYQHRYLLQGCALLSMCALLGGQWFVENILDFQTTLSVVINFIGGIYFLSLLLRNKVV